MSVETEVAKAGIKVTANMIFTGLTILLVLIVLGVGWWFIDDYRDLKENAKAHESVETVTSGTADNLTEATETVQRVIVTVEKEYKSKESEYENTVRNNQDAAVWDGDLIPDVVRQSDERALNRSEDNSVGSGVTDDTN